MTAAEARMQMYWNNLPNSIKNKIESAVIRGLSQITVDSLESDELENLKALGYCVQFETNFLDTISW